MGFVVGNRATLVIDTGLGPRNGLTILREAEKLSKNTEMYMVSTHFHPEHALGEPAFPASAKLIRSRAQQMDIDEFGLATANIFAARTPLTAELLKDVQFRRADELFDREKMLDLGGVRVRMLSYGSTHTRGDTSIFVDGDSVLFAGDIIMNHRFLGFASPYGSVQSWLNVIDQLGALRPAKIVPSHGNMGDVSLIGLNRDYLRALQDLVAELKRQGKTVEETAQLLTAEFRTKYPDWTAPNGVAPAARTAFNEVR